MLKRNFLKEKLKAGNPVVGTWAVIPSAVLADVVASSGIDFIIIDGEHGPTSFEMAQQMAVACESHGVSPMMRVGGIIEEDILRALDMGVHGLHIPNIGTRKDVERVIKLAKYPPIGNRGFSPFTRAGNYSRDLAADLARAGNENILLGVHVEGKDAVDGIDEILKCDELDIIFIGIFDISKSLGIPGDVYHPRVTDIVKKLAEKINGERKYPGTIANRIEDLKNYLDYGIKYITYSADCAVLKAGYEQIHAEFKKLVKK